MTKSDSRIGRRDIAQDVHTLRIVLVSCVMGTVFGSMLAGPFGAVVGSLLLSAIGLVIKWVLVDGTAGAVSSMLVPDTRGTAVVGYSHIEALEAKGDISGALSAWEIAMTESPLGFVVRIAAADLYARKGNNPFRAAEIFREVQRIDNCPAESKRYVTQRLVDLYLGPLRDEGRALVELRRIVERWPDTPEGRGAKNAIATIKHLT